MASRYPFVGAAAHLFPKNAIKMLSFSTSGKGSILLYPFRSSPLLAITFLYHPKDFFLYIQHCELLTTLENITNLQYRMISDYTERVQRLQRGSCTSKLMIDVVNYIRHHISEPITVEKMAEALFMSRPYLSRKFKEETGESLTDFILYEKTEEAKRLLRYSDKPITAISSYLGFSSPSHFSRVFKARVCITPGEYREKHQ